MVSVVLASLILILPLWYIWEWWTEGTIGGAEAMLMSCGFFALLCPMILFPSLRAALFLLLAASAVLMPYIASTVEKVASDQYISDKIETYRRAISIDPHNMAARTQLSKSLYKIGRLDEAIAEMEAAFQLSRLGFEEAQMLSDWKEERRIRDTRNVFCPACGKENEHGLAACTRCGRPLARGRAADWARSGGPRAAVRAWALAVACTTASMILFSLLPSLPSPNPLFIGAAGLLSWVVFYAVSRRKGRR